MNVIRHWVNTNRSLLNVCDECNNTPLHYAALHGHLDIIRMLINFGCDASIKGQRGWTPLHFACKGGHSNVVKMLLSKRSYNFMSVDDNGNLPIHIAATFGHWDIIQMLATDFGCDINIAGEHGWTALHYACQGGHISTVKKLIRELNCYPNKKNSKHGSTPIHIAALYGELDIVRLLVEEFGCNVNSRNEQGRMPLHAASAGGHSETVSVLILQFGCNPMSKDGCGYTPLHHAAEIGHVETVSMLVSEYGCNPIDKNDSGNTPLHIACMKGHCDVIKFFVSECGCSPSVRGHNGMTCMHSACQGGHVEAISMLISVFGYDPIYKDDHGNLPVYTAAKNGHSNVVKLLLNEFSCDINSVGGYKRTLLHGACLSGNVDTVRMLISEFGCDPMAKDICSIMPLHLSSVKGHNNVLKLLVRDYDCSVNAKGWKGRSTLHFACEQGRSKTVHMLISEFGCDPMGKDKYGNTSLHIATKNGQMDIITLLISEYGCSINARERNGMTPLHMACCCNQMASAKLLLSKFHCNAEAKDNFGNTPLHVACRNKVVNVVHMLISEFNVNTSAINDSSLSPLDIAASVGSNEVIKELADHMDIKGHPSVLQNALKNEHWDTVCMLIEEFSLDPSGNWDSRTSTPLHLACKKKDLDIVHKLIKEYCVKTMAVDKNLLTPFEIAVETGDIRIVKEFIGHVDIDKDTQYWLLHRAYTSGFSDVFRALIFNFHCNPNYVTDHNDSILHDVSEKKDWDMVHLLITEHNCNPCVNYDDWECSTPLHLACKNKEVDMAHKLISDFGVNTLVRDENGDSPLQTAIETGDVTIVKVFVGHTDMDNDGQYSHLRRACMSGHWDILRLLISDFGCDPNTESEDGDSILRDACEKKDWDMVRLLITEFGCDPKVNLEFWEGLGTPLHLACKNKDLVMVHKLISDFDVDTWFWDTNGDTALHIAIETGDMRIVKEFVGHTDMDNDDKYSHLLQACMSGHWDMFRALISDFGCDPNTETGDGDSILRGACNNNDWDMVRLLITEFGCDPKVNLEFWEGLGTPLHLACKNKDLVMVHKLISDFDVDTWFWDTNGDTALHIAIETGDMRIVKEFVGHTDMDNDDKYSHLLQACMSGHWDMFRALISDFGCDPNTETGDGDSILRDACNNNDWDMVRLLITEFGCDPKVNLEFWDDLSTPLHLACKNKDLVMVHKLISDFDVHTLTYNENGDTPLQIAIETGDMRIVKEFVGHTDMDNDDQYSHLRRACMSGHWDVLRVLISDFGCDPNTVTDDGDSILRDACVKKDWDMVHLLIIEFGCNRPSRASVELWEDLSTPIHLAIENSDLSMVCKLIQDFGVDVYDENGDSPLDLASRIGSINIVKEFIGYINTENHSSALLYACENGHMDVARMLITDLGFDPMGSKYHGFPLHHACMRETNLDTVLMLISEFDVNINDKNYDGETAVDIAIASGCIDIVKMLLNHTDISSSQLQKGLFNASSNGHLEMVEFLITDLGADPFARSISNDMAIHGAAEHGKVEVVSAMINKFNCNPAAEGHLRRTPLHHACVGGSYDLFNLLVSITDLDVQCKDVDDNTPMHIAAMHGRAEMVKDLTQMYGASTYCLNNKLQTPLHLALVNKHKQIADMLVSECNSQIIDVAGNSPLHLAAMCGCADMVSKLIQQYQSSPDCLNSKHQTPLHLALEEKHEEIADMLLSKFLCCPTSADIDGNTPLHVAVQYGLQGIVRKLQNQYKSIPDCRNNKQETPLFLAAKAKNWTIVDILVSKFGCCPMKANDTGSTPLHYAAMYGPTEINRKIIKQCQSTLDCMNNRRETPLLLAAKEKNWKIVDILLSEYGCCPMKANIDGNTPLYYAASHGPSGINRKIIERYKSTPDCMKSRQEVHLFLAAEGKNWSVVDILLSEFCCSPKAVDAEENTLLHIAAKNGNADLVTTLLSEYKVSSSPQNSSGHTPLYYATLNRHTRIVSELVKHNCNPAAFDDDYKALEEISHRKLSEGSLTKVFVIGNKCAGKSTLIEALKNEAQFDPYFSNKVTPHTAGIIPSIHHSKQYGRVLFYDFAGHPEYYSSHAAALEKLLSSSCHVFLLVVDFSDLEESILYTLRYWLTFISYNSKDLHPISQVIIVGSHADVIEVKGEDAERKVCELFTEISSEVCSQHPYTEMVGYCSLDCRQSDSIGIGNLYNLLKHCCISFPVDESRQLSVGAMLLLGVLQRDFKGILACEVSQICAHIQLTDIYLPQGLVSIYSYLQELNAQGVVLILGNHEDLKEEWVILDISTFLATVHKKLFSSTSLFHICNRKSLSNLGIIPESDLKNVLQEFDTKLLKQCLKHLQYCIELNDSEVLHKIFQDTCITSIETATNAPESVDNDKTVKTSDKGGDTPAAGSSSSKLLFFPALLSDTERTDINWYRKQEHASCKGWYIRCTCEYDYFPTRFIHVLLLRLAFNFALPPCNVRKQKTPKILDLCSRRCTMWKNGIHWLMKTEVECVVEVVNGSKGVIVMVRSKKEFDVDCACLYQNVINEVLKARQHFCHSLAAEAYLIHPNDLNQNCIPSITSLHLFDMHEVKEALTENQNAVISVCGKETLPLSCLQIHSMWSKLEIFL